MTTRRRARAAAPAPEPLEARRARALEAARVIALGSIYGADGEVYAVEDAPIEDLEAVLERKAARRRR